MARTVDACSQTGNQKPPGGPCDPALARNRQPDTRRIDPDSLIRSLAAEQHGLVTRGQLVAAGVPPHCIEYRLKADRLERVRRGVYRAGLLSGTHERTMAAVLACGKTAVASHRTAAALWRLLPEPPEGAPVDITIRSGFRKGGPSLRVHRASTLGVGETTLREGVPVTTPARTLLDLGGSPDRKWVEQALAVALREGLVRRGTMAELLDRHPGRPGSPALRALLDRNSDPALTRSEAEARLLVLVRKGRLREPETNVLVCGYEVDFLWRRERLVVEVDGFAFHSSQRAFERDRRRDGRLLTAGYRIMRVTWRQLTEEPEALLVRLARIIEG